MIPRSCPVCGAGIVIGTKWICCDANKYSSWSGAGDCLWELEMTPELRLEADETLKAQREIK